jgi:thiol-disulfide isomerase/thioredoxin
VKFAQLLQIVVIVLAAFGVYSFVTTVKDGEARRACSALCALKPNYAARNRQAPDFELPSMRDGRKKKLSDYRGKVVILNFWTKTCRPCLEEMPSLVSLGKALLRHPEVVLLTVTTDESAADARETLKAVLGNSSEPPFEVLIDSEASVVRDLYGTKLFPETWYIDERGVIRARFDGPREWDSALPVDAALSLSSPLPCEVTYSGGIPSGEHKGFCEELAPGGGG